MAEQTRWRVKDPSHLVSVRSLFASALAMSTLITDRAVRIMALVMTFLKSSPASMLPTTSHLSPFPCGDALLIVLDTSMFLRKGGVEVRTGCGGQGVLRTLAEDEGFLVTRYKREIKLYLFSLKLTLQHSLPHSP